jgi:hypothetical protein
MSNPFTATTTQALWSGSALTAFRASASGEALTDIETLDGRIAAFEAAIITDPTSASDDYPFDKVRLKREFLDEVITILDRTGQGGSVRNIDGANFNDSTDGWPWDYRDTGGTSYVSYLSYGSSAYNTYLTYSDLIDAAIAQGEAMKTSSGLKTQVVTATRPFTYAGTTYDKLATYSDISSKDSSGNPKLAQYLLAENIDTDKVTTGTGLSSSGNTSGYQIPIDLKKATYSGVVAGHDIFTANAFGSKLISLTRDSSTNAVTGLTMSGHAGTRTGINLSVGYGTDTTGAITGVSDGNLPHNGGLNSYQVTVSGTTYLVGVSQTGDSVFVTQVSPVTNRSDYQNLTAPEYLLHWTEERIRVLRGSLNYQKNVITEIQKDLEQANKALAELQTQYAALADDKATNAPTSVMWYWNAMASPAGGEFVTGSAYKKSDWESLKVKISNYIDRRSSESEQASLDYQSTLTKYNNAYEVMGKMQEKLDNLVKSQLRNLL